MKKEIEDKLLNVLSTLAVIMAFVLVFALALAGFAIEVVIAKWIWWS